MSACDSHQHVTHTTPYGGGWAIFGCSVRTCASTVCGPHVRTQPIYRCCARGLWEYWRLDVCDVCEQKLARARLWGVHLIFTIFDQYPTALSRLRDSLSLLPVMSATRGGGVAQKLDTMQEFATPPPPVLKMLHGGVWMINPLFLAKGGVPCAVRALCEKLAVLHHREFGKFRRLKGRH